MRAMLEIIKEVATYRENSIEARAKHSAESIRTPECSKSKCPKQKKF